MPPPRTTTALDKNDIYTLLYYIQQKFYPFSFVHHIYIYFNDLAEYNFILHELNKYGRFKKNYVYVRGSNEL